MGSLTLKRLESLEVYVTDIEGKQTDTIYGVVDKVIDGVPNVIRRWKGIIGEMVETDENPTILLGLAHEPAILHHRKYKLFFGGRAGMKSRFVMNAMTGEVNYSDSKVYVLRETMKSIKHSIFSGIVATIKSLNLAGFLPVPSQWEIRHKDGGLFAFGGMQNIEDMKGSFDFKFFLAEEAAKMKQKTIDTLGPTLRDIEGAELWYLWNPGSSNDPMSKEFILPYQAILDRDGIYMDEYHLIIKTTYRDNPWFLGDSSLRVEHEKDRSKMERGIMSKARYKHIWDGAFNDSIENALIEEDWFDACIDAHIKIGFPAIGAVVATHDPADSSEGDAKTIAIRKGVVFNLMEEIDAENGNRALDYACGIAIKNNADYFGWDCDGMGALLRDQVAANFADKKIESWMFRGSNSVDLPKKVFKAAENYGIKGSKTNEDCFKNRRAQRYCDVADRCFKTWEVITHNVYHDPSELISFCSKGIAKPIMQKLRAEMCRIPIKPNNDGTIELYSKPDMKKGIQMPDGSQQVIPSPNLADDVMMSFDNPTVRRKPESRQAPKRAPSSRGGKR